MTQQFIKFKDEKGEITPEFTAVIEVIKSEMRKVVTEPDECLTTKEACEFLKCGPDKLRSIRKALKPKRDKGEWKYSKKALVKYLNS